MRHKTFTNYLEELFMESSYAEGMVKDQMEEQFDRWLEDQDVAHMIEWGDRYGEELAASLAARA